MQQSMTNRLHYTFISYIDTIYHHFMKRLEKYTERKLNWLLAPAILVALILPVDLIFDLKLNSENWVLPILLAALMIPITAFAIAYIKNKCWGLLALTIALAIYIVWQLHSYL